MKIETHQKINRELCGTPVDLEENHAVIELDTTELMIVDETGLVHGGFIFGLADYAAMLAVNHPNVVLAGSSCKFIMPVTPGERLFAEAAVKEVKKNRYTVEVTVTRQKDLIFTGEFTCAVLKNHVLGGPS